VNVTDYAFVYANNRIDTVLPQIAPSSLTPLQKLQNITKWVARNTDYCVDYQSYIDMLCFQCGDCWASTNTIVAMGKRVGLDIKGRRGNQESGAGSGHRNALAIIDGRFYVGEAGYSGMRPRGWHVRELPLGFALYGSYIVQYDGTNSTITIPSRLGTTNVTGLGRNADVAVFMHTGYLKSLSIPAEIKYIASGVFTGETNLTQLTVDPKSEYFETDNNVLYSKWKKKLIFTPVTKTSVKIPENTTVIGTTALSHLNLKTLLIPSNVRTLELATFFKSTIGRLKIEYGVETINETVFNRLTTPKIILPDSVTFLGVAPFYYCNTSKVVLSKNITEIPLGCFQYSNITTLNIPSGVKTIGDSAFSSCSKLENITIPVSVTSVGKNAFAYTKNLTDIYYTGTEEQWNKITFATAIPDGKTIHFNSIPPEDEVDDEPFVEEDEITSNVVNTSDEDAGFPLWATITCSVVGAALIVGVIIAAVAIAKKKSSEKSSVEVEMGSVKDSQPAASGAASSQPSYPPPQTAYAQPAPAPAYAQPAPAPAAYGRPAPPPPAASHPRPAPALYGRPAPAPRGRPAPPPRY